MGQNLHITRVPAADYVGWTDAFASLSQRAADGNPHMSPASVSAATATLLKADAVVVLAAHAKDVLVGIWVLHITRDLWSAGQAVLEAPLVPVYDISSAPVLDAAFKDEVLDAMLLAITKAPDLPKLLRLPLLPTEGKTFAAFERATSQKRCQISTSELWVRPVMQARDETGEATLARSLGSNRKKRMGQRRAFAKLGELSFQRSRGPDTAVAFERFLAMEDAGWKGAAGTSLLRSGKACDYHRAFVKAFADSDMVMVDAVLLSGEPAAIGLLIESAGTVHYLKTAYDERHAKHSPGRILAMDMLPHVVDAPGFRFFDSGTGSAVNPDIHIWSDTRLMGHTLVACGGHGYRLVELLSRLRIWLRTKSRRWKAQRAA
ncbi:MAG: GNAT family N-acetyltransferase [Bosea sp. (in: a-proteobacteria)]